MVRISRAWCARLCLRDHQINEISVRQRIAPAFIEAAGIAGMLGQEPTLFMVEKTVKAVNALQALDLTTRR